MSKGLSFKEQVESELQTRWGIGINDTGITDETLAREEEAGTTPLEVATWWCDKVDLQTLEELSGGWY